MYGRKSHHPNTLKIEQHSPRWDEKKSEECLYGKMHFEKCMNSYITWKEKKLDCDVEPNDNMNMIVEEPYICRAGVSGDQEHCVQESGHRHIQTYMYVHVYTLR